MSSSEQIDERRTHDERSPLIPQNSVDHRVPASVARRLYVSHFLSTWNSRLFEFGAVLYLAAIFPGTLMPMSLYALVRGLSAVAFAPAVGMYIDRGDRLQVVRVSIGKSSTIGGRIFPLLIFYSRPEACRRGVLRYLLRPC